MTDECEVATYLVRRLYAAESRIKVLEGELSSAETRALNCKMDSERLRELIQNEREERSND